MSFLGSVTFVAYLLPLIPLEIDEVSAQSPAVASRPTTAGRAHAAPATTAAAAAAAAAGALRDHHLLSHRLRLHCATARAVAAAPIAPRDCFGRSLWLFEKQATDGPGDGPGAGTEVPRSGTALYRDSCVSCPDGDRTTAGMSLVRLLPFGVAHPCTKLKRRNLALTVTWARQLVDYQPTPESVP